MSVISQTQYQQVEYSPTVWAVLLHQVPHVNITFHRLENDRFRPDSELYLESLGIIGSVPAAWLILTLIVLLIYLLTRCCDTKNNKKRKSRPIRCCLSFFSLICCSALGAGFYGNHVFHSGAEKFSQSMIQIDRLVVHAQKHVQAFNDILQKDVEHSLNNLYDGTFHGKEQISHSAKNELLEQSDLIFYNISDGLKAMDKIRFVIYDPKYPVSVSAIPKSVSNFEVLRWSVTMGLLGLFSLFCLLLFIGAIVHSRAILILFSVCGLFSVILLWLLSSLYLTISVALADFCYSPTPALQLALSHTYNLSEGVTNYYLRCSQHKQHNPFQKALEEANQAVLNIEDSVKAINRIARSEYTEYSLNPSLPNLVNASANTLALMGELEPSLRCDSLYRFYNDALVASCNQGLFGLFVMLVSASFCALLFTGLVWCNSHTWIYFKHKGKYVKVEDQDPYMPLSTIDRGSRGGGSLGPVPGAGAVPPIYQRSRTVHTPPQTPPYHGTLNGHKNGTALQMTLDKKPLPGPPTLHAGVGYGVHTNGGPATMTLGRKGHYASLRSAKAEQPDLPLLGPNQGQYATLSRGCKTLQNDDFY